MLVIYAYGNMNSSILTALWYERTLFRLHTQCVHITLRARNINTLMLIFKEIGLFFQILTHFYYFFSRR